MLKVCGIKVEVMMSVMGLMRKRNNGSESTVSGRVKMMKKGLTKTLRKEKIILARMAGGKG